MKRQHVYATTSGIVEQTSIHVQQAAQQLALAAYDYNTWKVSEQEAL